MQGVAANAALEQLVLAYPLCACHCFVQAVVDTPICVARRRGSTAPLGVWAAALRACGGCFRHAGAERELLSLLLLPLLFARIASVKASCAPR